MIDPREAARRRLEQLCSGEWTQGSTAPLAPEPASLAGRRRFLRGATFGAMAYVALGGSALARCLMPTGQQGGTCSATQSGSSSESLTSPGGGETSETFSASTPSTGPGGGGTFTSYVTYTKYEGASATGQGPGYSFTVATVSGPFSCTLDYSGSGTSVEGIGSTKAPDPITECYLTTTWLTTTTTCRGGHIAEIDVVEAPFDEGLSPLPGSMDAVQRTTGNGGWKLDFGA